jgi:hypothetical protein
VLAYTAVYPRGQNSFQDACFGKVITVLIISGHSCTVVRVRTWKGKNEEDKKGIENRRRSTVDDEGEEAKR